MRRLIIPLAALTIVLATAAAAFAHAPVKTLSPKPGAHASTSLRHVTATFKEAIVSGSLNVFKGRTRVSVGKASRTRVSVGKAKLIRHKAGLQATLRSHLHSGTYTAKMKWLADDGHVERKTWTFKLS
jgi:methionine-rich copper-binding protein CopC